MTKGRPAAFAEGGRGPARRPVRGARLLAATCLLAIVGCGGCSPAYVLRAGWEEARILWRRRAIAEVVASPGANDLLREKLRTIARAREFAGPALGLSVGGAYASYAEVPDGALVHVLSAARRTRLEPRTWWFPIVGRVSYKGFFSADDARAEAAALEASGWDTWVRPSIAFSTLGWFDDPVLSSWMDGSRVAVVETVLHELLHRTVYLPGQTSFNESFATFVGHRGAIEFFAKVDGSDATTTAEARRAWQEEIDRSARLGGVMDRLRALYEEAGRNGLPEATVLERRRGIFAEAGDPDHLNNAVLLARYAYVDRLDWFERAWSAGPGVREAVIEIRRAVEREPRDPWAALARVVGEGERGASGGD